MATKSKKGPNVLIQPKFDPRIYQLAFPLTGTGLGPITRGYLIWDKPLPGYTTKDKSATAILFQYNPSVVSADYNIADASAQASLNFPNPGDTSMLAIPLSQTVSFSVMYDRTYEVQGGWKLDSGGKATPVKKNAAANDPSVVGVLGDLMQWQQFTGMKINYNYGTNGNGGKITAPSVAAQNYAKNQGIMQLVPAWLYFGTMSYFGYVSEWSPQITHWTQYQIPMRAVINVSFTMLPPPSQNNTTANTPNSKLQTYYTPNLINQPGTGNNSGPPPLVKSTSVATNGVAGR